jgi:hypothetical protein
MLTTFDLDDYVYEALRAGASGFLLKDASGEQLAAAVGTVPAGQALLAPAITRRLIEDFCRGPAPGAGATGRLSERELEVVRLVAQGLSNAEIAARLYLSEATVKSTLPASWPSWAYATACRSRSSPTRKASCGPAAADGGCSASWSAASRSCPTSRPRPAVRHRGGGSDGTPVTAAVGGSAGRQSLL